ncbi:hypothetical protein ABLG96_10720 [Nakamurella sp. A5-74]|uniref:Uncharacterized protein n=1 Tax=Nakamurella sp. A5-74 TaxID=3158264 RepID=A0AAU8DWV1_9ACTN
MRGVRFIDNAGSVNQVARVSISSGKVMVRFHRDPPRASGFAVESWCSRAAAAVGVPTPAALAARTIRWSTACRLGCQKRAAVAVS